MARPRVCSRRNGSTGALVGGLSLHLSPTADSGRLSAGNAGDGTVVRVAQLEFARVTRHSDWSWYDFPALLFLSLESLNHTNAHQAHIHLWSQNLAKLNRDLKCFSSNVLLW